MFSNRQIFIMTMINTSIYLVGCQIVSYNFKKQMDKSMKRMDDAIERLRC